MSGVEGYVLKAGKCAQKKGFWVGILLTEASSGGRKLGTPGEMTQHPISANEVHSE